jgi:hypothetical protein
MGWEVVETVVVWVCERSQSFSSLYPACIGLLMQSSSSQSLIIFAVVSVLSLWGEEIRDAWVRAKVQWGWV